jgi:hypothetical protein
MEGQLKRKRSRRRLIAQHRRPKWHTYQGFKYDLHGNGPPFLLGLPQRSNSS